MVERIKSAERLSSDDSFECTPSRKSPCNWSVGMHKNKFIVRNVCPYENSPSQNVVDVIELLRRENEDLFKHERLSQNDKYLCPLKPIQRTTGSFSNEMKGTDISVTGCI